jgi:hypothetical protein
MTAQGVFMQKESQNGTVKWQLADGEYDGGLPCGGGKNWRREGKLRPQGPFIGARAEWLAAGPPVDIGMPATSQSSLTMTR